MKWIRNLSLKFKLVFLLVILTGSMLSIYGILVLRDFEKDKIAYVLDSSRAHSRSAAVQISTEVTYIIERINTLMKGYQPATQQFSSESQALFREEKRFDYCLGWIFDEELKKYNLVDLQKSDLAQPKELEELKNISAQLRESALKNEIAVLKLSSPSHWALGLRFKNPTGPPLVIITAINASRFLSLFDLSQIYDTYLVDEQGHSVMPPMNRTYHMESAESDSAFREVLDTIKAPEGVHEYKDQESKSWLISTSSLGFGGLRVMSLVPRSAALEAIYLIIIKSAFFLVFLLFVTIFISVLASTSLTTSLQELLLATREISQGHFNIQVDFKSEDEVGSLAKGFNKMAVEIQRLMKEIVEKVRMEAELKTAQLVQTTLFPKEDLVESDLEIRGFYQSASECSGDWWHYQKVGSKTFFCIGDATGHGVPAALLTSAARSAASTLETFPDIPLNVMMSIFNKAIYNTARGEMLMTFFLGVYDHNTGIVNYVNASHEPPVFLPQKETLAKNDIEFLHEVNNPSLGRDSNVAFESAQWQLNPGDRLFIYTDGLTELKNAQGDMWGERALMKCVLSCINEKKDTVRIIRKIADEVTDFRKEQILHDDVTFFIVARSPR